MASISSQPQWVNKHENIFECSFAYLRSDSHLCAGVVSGQEELEGDMDTTISLQSQGSVKDLIQAFQQQAEQVGRLQQMKWISMG